MPEVAADVGEGGPVPWQAGGQGVPGLVGDPAADVKFVHPCVEPEVVSLVGDRGGPVRGAVAAGEQFHCRPLLAGRGMPMPGDEAFQGCSPALAEPLIKRVGDADRWS